MHDRGLAQKSMNCQQSRPLESSGLNRSGSNSSGLCLVRNVQHDDSKQIEQTTGSNGGRRNAYSTTELTDSRRGISLRARNQATRRPARRQHGSGAKPTTARRRRSAPRRAERRAAPLPRRPRRSSAFSSDLTHRCRIVHPQHRPEKSRLQWQRVVIIGSGATAVRPAIPTPPRT